MGDPVAYFIGLSIFVVIFVCVILVALGSNSGRSKKYRQYIANMYVAGRIRQLAERDKIDLLAEEKKFLEYESLSAKRRMSNLDNAIEEELMSRIETKDDSSKKK